MKFGLGIFSCDLPEGSDRTHPEVYQEMLDAAQLAEENRFDSFWVTEHHFAPGGYMPSVTTSMAALAAVTEDIQIGTNIALGPLYKQPVRLAEDLATIDIISNGRVRWGVGNGYRVEEFRGFNIPTSERPGRLTEGIKILRKSWSPGPFSFDGEFFQYEDVNVTPKPVQGADLPIIIGAFAPPAVRRAARLGDGYTTGSLLGLDQVQEALDVYYDELEELGKDPEDQELMVYNFGFIHKHKDPEEVTRVGWQHTKDQYGEWYHNAGMIEHPKDLHAGFDEAVMFYDDPGKMVDRLRDYQDVFGEDFHFVFDPAVPEVPFEDLRHTIKVFGNEVIPEFQ